MPFVVVEALSVHLESSTVSTSSSEGQVTVTQICADHIGTFHIADQKDHAGLGIGPKVDVKSSPEKVAPNRKRNFTCERVR